MKTYQIVVVDDNGWGEGCPDYRSVFFGSYGTYVPPSDDELDIEHISVGYIAVVGQRSAKNVLMALDREGDWVAPPEINPEGLRTAPTYRMVAL